MQKIKILTRKIEKLTVNPFSACRDKKYPEYFVKNKGEHPTVFGWVQINTV